MAQVNAVDHCLKVLGPWGAAAAAYLDLLAEAGGGGAGPEVAAAAAADPDSSSRSSSSSTAGWISNAAEMTVGTPESAQQVAGGGRIPLREQQAAVLVVLPWSGFPSLTC
jgi:hypothetical protein